MCAVSFQLNPVEVTSGSFILERFQLRLPPVEATFSFASNLSSLEVIKVECRECDDYTTSKTPCLARNEARGANAWNWKKFIKVNNKI